MAGAACHCWTCKWRLVSLGVLSRATTRHSSSTRTLPRSPKLGASRERPGLPLASFSPAWTPRGTDEPDSRDGSLGGVPRRRHEMAASHFGCCSPASQPTPPVKRARRMAHFKRPSIGCFSMILAFRLSSLYLHEGPACVRIAALRCTALQAQYIAHTVQAAYPTPIAPAALTYRAGSWRCPRRKSWQVRPREAIATMETPSSSLLLRACSTARLDLDLHLSLQHPQFIDKSLSLNRHSSTSSPHLPSPSRASCIRHREHGILFLQASVPLSYPTCGTVQSPQPCSSSRKGRILAFTRQQQPHSTR